MSFANKPRGSTALKRPYPDGHRSEELQPLLRLTSGKWFEDANTAPLPIHYPAEVRTKLESIFGAYPNWEQIKATLKRVYSDRPLEKTLIADLERLYNNEDSFQWPLDDPHYCLILGLMRDCHERLWPGYLKTRNLGRRTKTTRPTGGNLQSSSRPAGSEEKALHF
jgi:hypothetical protein